MVDTKDTRSEKDQTLDPSVCKVHSRVIVELEHLRRWTDKHEGRHEALERKVDRMPNWATFIMSGLVGIIGYLIAMLQVYATIN